MGFHERESDGIPHFRWRINSRNESLTRTGRNQDEERGQRRMMRVEARTAPSAAKPLPCGQSSESGSCIFCHFLQGFSYER